MTLPELIRLCGIPGELSVDDQYGIPCRMEGNPDRQFLCDYNRLYNREGQMIGQLLTLMNADMEKDLMTGFERWEYFHQTYIDRRVPFPHPTAVAVIDIIGLGEINRTLGREEGDRHIRDLSILLRRVAPPEAKLIRGFEAHLVAVCPNCTEQELSACM